MQSVEVAVRAGLSQVGRARYDYYGSKRIPAHITDPATQGYTFNCSIFTAWCFDRAGVKIPAQSWQAYLFCKEAGLDLSVDAGLRTRGALMVRKKRDGDFAGHVAISLGDGRVVEAANTKLGIRTHAYDQSNPNVAFTHAGKVPSVSYSIFSSGGGATTLLLIAGVGYAAWRYL